MINCDLVHNVGSIMAIKDMRQAKNKVKLSKYIYRNYTDYTSNLNSYTVSYISSTSVLDIIYNIGHGGCEIYRD